MKIRAGNFSAQLSCDEVHRRIFSDRAKSPQKPFTPADMPLNVGKVLHKTPD